MGETNHAKFIRILAAMHNQGISDEMIGAVLRATGMDSKEFRETMESAVTAAKDIERRL